MFHLPVSSNCKTIIRHVLVFLWSTICPSSLSRPSCLQFRQIGLHTLALSVGRILKPTLFLLAFRQQQIFFKQPLQMYSSATYGALSKADWLIIFFILHRIFRGWPGWWGPPLYFRNRYFVCILLEFLAE